MVSSFEEHYLQFESFALFFNPQICHKGRRHYVSLAVVHLGEVEGTADSPRWEKLTPLNCGRAGEVL